MLYLFKVTHCGIFQQMVCEVCNRPSEGHDLCRAHAYCGSEHGARYHGAPCLTCRDLWEMAEDIDAIEEAQHAFGVLDRWISGFRRDSRFRHPGESHFICPEEKRRFEQLYARLRAEGHVPRSYSAPSSSCEVSSHKNFL